MPGHGPVLSLGRPLGDVQDVAAGPPARRVTYPGRAAGGVPAAQLGGQLLAQRAAALHEQRQVDRLVRHLHLQPVRRTRSRSHRAICCGDHCNLSLAATTAGSADRPPACAALGRTARAQAAPSAAPPDTGAGHRCGPPPGTPSTAPAHPTAIGRSDSPPPPRARSPPAPPATAAAPNDTAAQVLIPPVRCNKSRTVDGFYPHLPRARTLTACCGQDTPRWQHATVERRAAIGVPTGARCGLFMSRRLGPRCGYREGASRGPATSAGGCSSAGGSAWSASTRRR